MLLIDFLTAQYPHLSKNKIKGLLTKGAIRVDGIVRTRYDYPVEENNKVEIIKGSGASGHLSNADRNMRRFATIEYEDKWLLVIQKKEGVLSVPSGHHSFSLKALLDEYLERKGEKSNVHVVHRLDKETSGLLLFAKSRQVQQILTDNWKEIVQDRRYYAITSGIPTPSKGTIQSYLHDDQFYYTHSSPTDDGGKLAITHYQILKTEGNHALLDVKLDTGRKNQIRVHMQEKGTPVVGDLKYGNGDNCIGRLALHAYRLSFYHPITHRLMTFETPLPKGWVK